MSYLQEIPQTVFAKTRVSIHLRKSYTTPLIQATINNIKISLTYKVENPNLHQRPTNYNQFCRNIDFLVPHLALFRLNPRQNTIWIWVSILLKFTLFIEAAFKLTHTHSVFKCLQLLFIFCKTSPLSEQRDYKTALYHRTSGLFSKKR